MDAFLIAVASDSEADVALGGIVESGQVIKGTFQLENRESNHNLCFHGHSADWMHLQQPVSLCVMASVLKVQGRVLQRTLDAEGGISQPQGFHSRNEQGDGATNMRTGHRGTIHQLGALEGEVRH